MAGVIVVVDTNVFVSALLSPAGPPARLLAAILSGRVACAFDARMMDELREVLARPKFAARIPVDLAAHVLDAVSELGTLVNAPSYARALVDEDDRPFLEVAIAVAGLLVTGNVRHFPMDASVQVVLPGEALGILGI